MTDAKPRKPRKLKPTAVELRLIAGAKILKTSCEDAPLGCFYVFADTGRTARADIVHRLIKAGKLQPQGDGLFGDDSQTWALASGAPEPAFDKAMGR